MSKRYLVLIITLLVCVAVGGTSVLGQSKAKKAKIKAAKVKLSAVQSRIQKMKRIINQKEKQKKTVVQQLSDTQEQLEIKQSSVAKNSLRLQDAQFDLRQTIKRLERTKKQLARRQAFLATRVSDIYRGEDISYANVMLGAVDMWSFLNQAYYVKCILDTDTQLLREIKQDKIQIEADKARQTKTITRIQGLHKTLLAERDEIKALADEKYSQVLAIEHDKDLYEKALNELEAESRQIESRIQAYQRTALGRQMMGKTFKGGLSWPCSGRVSSSFGYRVHPITGVYKLHTGIDISARTGTPIRAAADGVVIQASRERAYGNCIIIDHGGGVSTLYGHCSRLYVSSGQRVSKGQVIGAVGSTGYSTGPHLHFERRQNGSPVNPR